MSQRKTYKATYKGPSGDSQGTNTKIYDFMKKLFFISNSRCITYLFLFLEEEQIFKSSKQGRLRDPIAGRPWEQMMEHSKNVRET